MQLCLLLVVLNLIMYGTIFILTLCVFSSKSNIKREDELGLQYGRKISTLYSLQAEKGEVGGLCESLKDSNFAQ